MCQTGSLKGDVACVRSTWTSVFSVSDHDGLTPFLGYATIVVLLFILRTEGLRREVCAFLSGEQEAGSGTEAELGASAEGSISAL